jgi:FtsH-binding integral membrane protein
MRNMEKYMDEAAISQAQTDFLSKVYAWMVGGLLLTGATAWFVYDSNIYITIASNTILFFGLIIAEFALVLGLSGMIRKLSSAAAAGLFLLFSFINGLTFSVIFAAYTIASIQQVFFIAAGMFAALSFYGITTKKDMSGLGKFMFMGLIGIIIASIVNFIFVSSALNFAISVIGVIVFAGLTVYDTQKLKEMYVVQQESGDMAAKLSILGALTLYLDFINLFLFLLRLFGDRR